jgi:hypothetical protein
MLQSLYLTLLQLFLEGLWKTGKMYKMGTSSLQELSELQSVTNGTLANTEFEETRNFMSYTFLE